MLLCAVMRRGVMKRWIWVTALVIAAAVAFVTLRERTSSPPLEEEIDDASKQALREILRQEDE